MDCEYYEPDGICKGNLDMCCVYQRIWKRDGERDLKSIRECYCNYPNVSVSPEYERAIHGLAEAMYGKEVET